MDECPSSQGTGALLARALRCWGHFRRGRHRPCEMGVSETQKSSRNNAGVVAKMRIPLVSKAGYCTETYVTAAHRSCCCANYANAKKPPFSLCVSGSVTGALLCIQAPFLLSRRELHTSDVRKEVTAFLTAQRQRAMHSAEHTPCV